MESNARFMKKKVKAGAIEIDYDACALVVNYEVEATVLGDMGEAIVADRKHNQKVIRLKTLNEHTDIPRLTGEIMEKCTQIHESKRGHVEELLRGLQHHLHHGGGGPAARKGSAGQHADRGGGGGSVPAEPEARLDALGDYIDACYDGIEASITATASILALAREPTNLEHLVADDRLLGCVTRVLADEGKKSSDLAINIVSIVYALSSYSDFHQKLLDFKVGSMVMDVVDLEIKRHALREREKAGRGGAPESAEDEKRDRVRLRKQEKLLYVCLHVLLNLAEDINTERKMCNYGIVPMLTAMLGRQNADLLILVVAFLKKLSIFQENADEMAKARLGDKLIAFVPNKHEQLLEQVLHLLFNLSFHPKCRAQLGKAGLTPKLLSLLRKGRHRLLAVRLLYQLSAQDDERAKMSQSVPMLVGTVINTPDPSLIPPEVLALVVNLMTNAECARACAKARGALRGLVTLGVRHQHHLALKVLRNMSAHEGADHCEELARTYAADLLAVVRHGESVEVQVEAMAILANLPLDQVEELPDLAVEVDLLGLLQQQLEPGHADDDVVLEACRLAGALAAHDGCAPAMARAGTLLQSLAEALDHKQEDDEIVLAVVFAFYRLLFNADAREVILTETQLVTTLLDLLGDKNAAIRRHASLALDLVMEHDTTGHWPLRIRDRKYRMHNQEWLDAVEEDDVEQYEEAMAFNEARGKIGGVHDIAELDQDEDGSDDGVPSSRSRLDYEAGGYADGYGAEYGLDMRAPGELAGHAHAYGALSDEAYLGMGVNESDSYDDGEEEDYDDEVEED